MSHLILPIILPDDAAYCCTCVSGRATKGILTSGVITAANNANVTGFPDGCSPWLAMEGYINDEGELSFGVCCGSTVEFSITSEEAGGDTYGIDVKFYVDGVLDSTVSVTDAAPTVASHNVTVSGGACGSIVTIASYSVATADPVPTPPAGLMNAVVEVLAIS